MFVLMILTVVAGLHVSRDNVPIPWTDMFDNAWTDDTTTIHFARHSVTFQSIHSLSPPITLTGSSREFVACTALDNTFMCATLE